MADYVTLLGSEQVANASHTMSHAADKFSSAVSNLDDVLFRHCRNLESLVERIEAAMEKFPEVQP